MRLTLRTMLCYLDDVLEPADAAELGKKIEESEYASQVVHRIRTSMRRLRLGAPKLSGDSYDPNTVADYLDNTLPAEQVPDFERVCLDPDTEVQLAEVAACHQILTLVLGEPAEVPQSMRQRIYDLPHTAGALRGANGVATTESVAATKGSDEAIGGAVGLAAVAPTAATGEAAAAALTEPRRVDDADAARHERHKPEIPAYLKEGTAKRSWMPAAIVLTLAGLAIAGIAYMARNPNRPSVVVTPPTKDHDDKLFEEADDQDISPKTGDAKIGTAVGDDDAAAVDKTNDAPTRTSDDLAADGATTKNDAETSNDDLVVAPAGDGGNTDAGTTTDDGSPDKEPVGADSVASVDPVVDPSAPPGEGTGAALPLVDKVLGHYISSGQVLVSLDPKAETWNRLASRAGVKPGMHLRSLPTFRPQVLLDNAMQITVSGDSELIVGNPTDDGTPFLIMPFGRVVLATVSEAGNAVVIRAGEREAKLTMVNADAAVALEVARFHLPGVDPASEPPHEQVTLAVTSGQVEWLEAGGKSVTLDAGQQLQFVDDNAAAVAAAAAPKWIKSSDVSDIDRRASATLEPLLADDGPIEVKLEELSEDSRVEVRSLAMRSLASLDRFERVLEAFQDDRLKSYWSQHIEQLQGSLAHGAPVAAELRAAAVRASGAEGDKIYRLLWGYSPEQLKSGSAQQLVELLKHESLDFRVLASNALRTITGRTQGYHPHLPEARRRTAERQWEQSLAAGEVVYATPPLSLPPRKLVEKP